ncbi:type II toxin-antitoxin system RelE/ParE family toxin [Azospirillum sp.]|uniref:type II toxin-antitoxin system RelE/ParE family toxin n=1 Tax=Azospirillum sp. TaxID=34012 RepID=UPI002D3F44B8|nr:type II toxin-antitoxin system RelE/ParE family toxin [Azospirillum sp.]HYF90521.1 type II toxin-antitoxin system RelE/ParE family toxin [Azospirillum sp.]
MARLELTAAAEADLEQIADYIAHENPLAAVRLVLDIREHCRKIAAVPGIGRARPELGPNLRSLALQPYVIVYSHTEPHRVIVIRIIHGARDLPRIMQD